MTIKTNQIASELYFFNESNKCGRVAADSEAIDSKLYDLETDTIDNAIFVRELEYNNLLH